MSRLTKEENFRQTAQLKMSFKMQILKVICSKMFLETELTRLKSSCLKTIL